MGLGVDQLIQLGLLIVAVIGMTAAAAAAVRRFVKARTGIRFSARVMGDGPFYLHRLEAANQPSQATVASVAGWVRLTITNNTGTPVVVTEIRAYETSCAIPRKIIGNPFREATLRHKDIELRTPVLLPVQVPAHDAMQLWALAEIMLPHGLGRLVFQQYLGPSVSEGIRARFAELAFQVVKDAQASIKYARVEDISVERVGMADPIVQERDHQHVAEPRLGLLPQSALSDLVSHCLEHQVGLPKEPAPDLFRIEVALSDGRTLRTERQTAKDPFWFFKERSLSA